jgi:hypothetical protein
MIMSTDVENKGSCDVDQDSSSHHDDGSIKQSSGIRQDNSIGTKETKDVVCLRFLVFMVLFVSAVSVAVSVYLIIRNEERAKFKEAYNIEKEKIYETMSTALKSLVGSLDLLSTDIISYSHSSNSTWPFVTIPDFPNRVSKLLSNGVAITISLSCIIKPENRLKWEEYAMNNSDIVEKSLRLMETDKNFYGEPNWNHTIAPQIVTLRNMSEPIPYNTTYVQCW